jgi:hypothetical protein
MTQQQRAVKRWKRENGKRNPSSKSGTAPYCRTCGHKLTRFGCPNCQPSLGSVGLDMVQRGDIPPEAFLLAALAGRR